MPTLESMDYGGGVQSEEKEPLFCTPEKFSFPFSQKGLSSSSSSSSHFSARRQEFESNFCRFKLKEWVDKKYPAMLFALCFILSFIAVFPSFKTRTRKNEEALYGRILN